MTLAQNIKTARTKAGLTQFQVAQRIDEESMTVSRWERGENSPSIAKLKTLAAALKTTVEVLVKGV